MASEARASNSSWRELFTAGVGFVLATVALTYPQARYLSTRVGDHYDALFSVWRLAWIAHALGHDPRHFFDANIFWPEKRTLAHGDALLLPGLIGAPMAWLGVSPLAAHNVLLLSTYVAAATAMYFFVRELTGCPPAAWFAGFVFAFVPYRAGHYNQFEMMWSWPVPLAFWSFHRLVNTRRIRYAILLGLFIAAQAWSSLYYFVFLVTALAILAPLMVVGRSWTDVRGIFVALFLTLIVSAALVIPYALVYRSVAADVGFRAEQEMRDYSATWSSYVSTAPQNWLYGRTLPGVSSELFLFPGIAALVAAVIGLWPPLDRTRVAYAVLLIAAVDLSLGTNGIGYTTLFHTFSMYRALRVPARMYVIVSAALAVLGGFGVARLLRIVTQQKARSLVAAVFLGAAIVENISPPDPVPVGRIPFMYQWLKQQPTSVVLEWPLPKASNLGSTHEPMYLYYSTEHWQKLVNGYSGFYPRSYIELLETMTTFPSPESVALLRERSVQFVILHREFDPPGYARVQNALLGHPDFEPVAAEGVSGREITAYRLRARATR